VGVRGWGGPRLLADREQREEGKQRERDRKGLGTRYSHEPVLSDLLPPAKSYLLTFSESPKIAAPAGNQAFNTGACGRYFTSNPNHIVACPRLHICKSIWYTHVHIRRSEIVGLHGMHIFSFTGAGLVPYLKCLRPEVFQIHISQFFGY
jgi:hypothetical protein